MQKYMHYCSHENKVVNHLPTHWSTYFQDKSPDLIKEIQVFPHDLPLKFNHYRSLFLNTKINIRTQHLGKEKTTLNFKKQVELIDVGVLDCCIVEGVGDRVSLELHDISVCEEGGTQWRTHTSWSIF